MVETLDRLKLCGRTLVPFLSDNEATGSGSNAPLRGAKGRLWEGGHRVPAIARWPGRIEPGVTDATACGFDLCPTLAAVTGVPLPKGVTIDGVDLSPVLFAAEPLPDRTLVWGYQKQRAVRRGRWKFVRRLPGVTGEALFDLATDPAETRDVAGEQPGVTADLRAALAAWEQDVAIAR